MCEEQRVGTVSLVGAGPGDPDLLTRKAARLIETARVIALAIAAVGAMLDPEVVILGGGIGVRQELVDAVRRILPRCTPSPPRVEASILGGRAGLVGALGVAVDRMHDVLFGVGLPVTPLLTPSTRPQLADANPDAGWG